jgi:hypothetical protein
MSTEPTQEQQTEEATMEAPAEQVAVVEPVKPADGPRIHLYTSLSSGSSYVPLRLSW